MADLDYAKITGRFALTVGDGPDGDDDPDIIYCDGGTVLIEPLVTYTKVAAGSPVPFTAGHSVISAAIDSSGYLTFNGKRYVYVVDLTSDKVNPTVAADRATHKITFVGVTADGTDVNFETVNVRVSKLGANGDGINDLTIVSPVASAPAQPIYRGETGAGVSSASIDAGDLLLALSDGTELNAGALPVGPGGSAVGVASYVADEDGPVRAALAATFATKSRKTLYIAQTGVNDHITVRDAWQSGEYTDFYFTEEGPIGWDANAPAFTVPVSLRAVDKSVAWIQLGPAAQYGPTWRGSRPQIGGSNVVASVAAGAMELATTTDLTGSLSVGDQFLIGSQAYGGSRFYHRTAEWCRVADIDADSILLASPLYYGYNTLNTITLRKYNLLGGAVIRDLGFRAHPDYTVKGPTKRQTLAWMQWCDRPQIWDAEFSGERATVGLELQECWMPAGRIEAYDILDLANAVKYTWEGYAARSRGCVDAKLEVNGSNCRHLTDSSSLDNEPSDLRPYITGVARDCVSAGFSTHGGSRDARMDVTTKSCGGSVVLRGDGADVTVRVDGISNPDSDIYTTEFDAVGVQSYQHAVALGEREDIATTGGIRSLAGTRLNVRFEALDMTGGDETCHAVGLQYAVVDGMNIDFGPSAIVAGGGSAIKGQHYDRFEDVKVRGRVRNATTAPLVDVGAGVAGVAMRRVDIELDVDGYAGTVAHLGGKTTSGGTRAGDVRCVIRATGKGAGYSAAAPVVKVDGWWDASTKTLDLGGSHLRESTQAAIDAGTANGGAGLSSSLYHRVPSLFTDRVLGDPAVLDSGGLLPASLLPGPVPLLVGGFLPVTNLSATRLPLLPDFVYTSGFYYFAGSPTAVGTALMSTNGEFRSAPVYLPKSVTIARLGAEVTAVGSAGSLYRLGVYADDGTGKPGASVIDAGTIDGTSATVQEITLGAPVTLAAGWYHFGGAPQGGAATGPTMRSVGVALGLVSGGGYPVAPNGATQPTAGQTVVGYRASGVTDALPATLTSPAGGGSAPRLFYKVS